MHIFICRLNTWESLESGNGTNFINLYCVGLESMSGLKMKYRKKDRTLIVWEECCICKKVKDGDVAETGRNPLKHVSRMRVRMADPRIERG